MKFLKVFLVTGFFLTGLACWQVYEFIDSQFSIENITYPFSEDKKASPSNFPNLQNVAGMLDQTFTYLDQGTQSYVFLSQDQKYVIKFFKFRHLKLSPLKQWFSFIPFVARWQGAENKSKLQKLEGLFSGFKLAYEQDKENSALVYLQLEPNPSWQRELTLIDRFGFQHRVPLNEVRFVIQERGESTRKIISQLLDRNDLQGVKVCFRQIFDLYLKEYEKGIWDRDHNVMYNTGFVGGKAVRLDVGRLRADERFTRREWFKPDLEKVGYKRINRWLKTHYPQYHSEIMNDIKAQLSSLAETQSNCL